jgi:hypothetical protein
MGQGGGDGWDDATQIMITRPIGDMDIANGNNCVLGLPVSSSIKASGAELSYHVILGPAAKVYPRRRILWRILLHSSR